MEKIKSNWKTCWLKRNVVRYNHQLYKHELIKPQAFAVRQFWWSSSGHKESEVMGQLNNNNIAPDRWLFNPCRVLEKLFYCLSQLFCVEKVFCPEMFASIPFPSITCIVYYHSIGEINSTVSAWELFPYLKTATLLGTTLLAASQQDNKLDAWHTPEIAKLNRTLRSKEFFLPRT